MNVCDRRAFPGPQAVGAYRERERDDWRERKRANMMFFPRILVSGRYGVVGR
jgi:hypothetical protein